MVPESNEYARQEPGMLGLVWVDLPDQVSALSIERALKATARVYRGKQAPTMDSAVLVVSWASDPREVAEGVERVSTEAPGVPVVVFGPRAEVALAGAAMRAGARGFLHAGMPPGQLARALHVAFEGEIVLPRDLLAEFVARERPADLSALGPRKLEILELVAEGLSNAQIAGKLYLSESTVKQHLRGAYKMLGVKNRNQAANLLRRKP